MKVERIDHIHIYVKDLKDVAKFFSEIMGSKWIGPMEIPEANAIVAFDNLGIELQQATSPDTPVARFVESRGNALASIGIKVPNIDEAIAELEAKGIRITWRGGSEYLKAALTHPKDTKGIMLELLEFDHVTAAAVGNAIPNVLKNLPSPI